MSDVPVEMLMAEPMAGCEPAIGHTLWMLESGRARLRERLAGLDEALLDWTPAGDLNSVGTLLYHLGDIEASWLYDEVLQASLPAELEPLFAHDTRDPQGRLTHISEWSLADHFQRLDTIRGYLLRSFQQMSLDDFRRPRHLERYAVTPEWILFHLLHHEAEHCGEIGLTRQMAERAHR